MSAALAVLALLLHCNTSYCSTTVSTSDCETRPGSRVRSKIWQFCSGAGGDDQLQVLAWAELLSLAAGTVADTAEARIAGSETVGQGPAAAAQRGWSGWDAGAAAGAAKASAAPASAAAAQLPGSASHSTAGLVADHSRAFAAFMDLLLEFFAWRSRVPAEALASPSDQQVRSIILRLAVEPLATYAHYRCRFQYWCSSWMLGVWLANLVVVIAGCLRSSMRLPMIRGKPPARIWQAWSRLSRRCCSCFRPGRQSSWRRPQLTACRPRQPECAYC